jgi:hypothetical protein
MLVHAALSLLVASGVVGTTISYRHESPATLSSSSSGIARRIHHKKCHGPPPPTVYFPLNFRKSSTANGRVKVRVGDKGS